MSMSMKEQLQMVVGVPIVISDVNYPNQYADDLSIDRTDLESEFIQHAERYAYYATLAEMAEDRFTRLKEELDTLSAQIDKELRNKYEVVRQQDPKFKMTEAMFEHDVKLDTRYQTMQKQMQDARHLAKVMKCAPMAFAHRRDMLIELAKVHLAGMHDPRIRQGNTQQVRNIIAGNRRTEPAPSLPLSAYGDEVEPAITETSFICSVCREPQFNAPGGLTCKNGHGGADSLGDDPVLPATPVQQSNPAPARRRAPRTNQ